jgi:hypothetical protein
MTPAKTVFNTKSSIGFSVLIPEGGANPELAGFPEGIPPYGPYGEFNPGSILEFNAGNTAKKK